MTAPSTAVRAAAKVPEDARQDADVIVVGAGPAGSSAAYWLATAGLDVLMLEKTTFPREKVCGDGLTPRAVHSSPIAESRSAPRSTRPTRRRL